MLRNDQNKVAEARRLVLDGFTPQEVGERLGCTGRTIRNWIKRYGWELHGAPEIKLERQLDALLDKDNQTEDDLHRIDALSRSLAKLRKGQTAKRDRVEASRKQGGGEGLDSVSWATPYQRRFLEDPATVRIVKKSRQIGWSFIMAWEGLIDALKRGRDKSYMSSSFLKTQQINRYIKLFARQKFGMKLKGTDTIKLPNGAEIHFLASNPATAQGVSGDMYFDEFAWLMRAQQCFENAAAIATQKDYRITICSTPSVHSHYFEELWDETRGRMKASRHQVTIIDAINQGAGEFIDLQKLLDIFSPRAIRRLFMCETLDDEGGAFTFDEVMACVHDDKASEALFQWQPSETLWAGIDISRRRDDTSLMIVAVTPSGQPVFTFRDKRRFSRMSLPAQEAAIAAILQEHPVEYCMVDQTQIGEHMVDALSDDFDGVQGVRFNVAEKARMVINMQTVVRSKRLRLPFDQRLIDSFLAIKLKALESAVGYESEHGENIGHADDFWALALACLPAYDHADENGYLLIA